MSHEDKYRDSHQHYERKDNVIGKMLGEVPIVGEIFESLGQAKIGKKSVKKLFCCCAPVALVYTGTNNLDSKMTPTTP